MILDKSTKMKMNRYFNEVINFIFSANCRTCDTPFSSLKEKYICQRCFSKIDFVGPPYCDKCGKLLVESFSQIQRPLCRECQTAKRYFYQARGVGLYENILRESIHLLKFKKKKCLHKPLGELMVNYLKEQQRDLIRQIDFIVPVPLHRKRLKLRGFNQAELLAGYMGKQFNLPLNFELKRIRYTIPQMNLPREERLENIKEAFEVKNPDILVGKTLLLVDDIFTTGATVNECSQVLIKAGAKQVLVLTLARGR